MTETKKYNFMNIVAVMSVSTLLYLAMINSASLPYLVQEFPQYDITTVKLFTTIPSLMMIVCSLVSGKLIQIFPIKKIVVGCCVLMLVAGFGTYFVFNLPGILILRVIYGMGSGTVFPLANAIIQQLFEGEQRAKLMGFRAAFGALFGAAVTMIGGWLTAVQWRYAFFGYLFAIPVAMLVLFFCPSNEPIKKEKDNTAVGEKKYTSKTWLVLLFVIIFNACMMSFNVELSLVVTGENIGGAQDVSMISSTNTIFAFIAGLAFGALQKKTKRYMAIISTGLVGVALVLGCLVQSVPLFMVCAALFGLGFGFYNPTYNLLIASTAAKPKYGSQAIAIYTSCVGLGQFLSPYLVDWVKQLVGLTAARSEWMITGTCTVVLVVLATLYIIFTGSNRQKA
jgi:MFS family permease